jgi:hypothetical protein
MPNVPVSGTYPAVEFQPSETSSVYHTDQEFTDSSGNSYMFRTYNAQYYPLLIPPWTLFDNSLPAYATVQNPDGSIHYYTNPSGMTSWTAWVGSDNNTVYNAVDFGLTAGGIASDNTTALASLFTAMGPATAPALGGGSGWIPQYNFPVNASAGGQTVPDQAIFQGLGTGGQSHEGYPAQQYHFSINDDPDEAAPGIFLNCSGSHTTGGTYFKNLAFQWVTPGYATDLALLLDYWNTVVEGCTFTDCPTALNFQGLGCEARHCTLRYGSGDPENATAMIMQGINCAVVGPSEMSGDLVPGTVFMSIGGGTTNCNIIHLDHLHVDKYDYGLDYSDLNDVGVGSGCQEITVSHCVFECVNTCVYMTPQTPDKLILDQHFTDNVFMKGQDSTNGDPIVFIDSNTGLATNVGPIFFNNCLIFSDVTDDDDHSGEAQSNQYGLRIGKCEYVSVIGGQISQVGGNSADVTGTANVCISDAATSVSLSGVNLNAVCQVPNAGRSTGTMGSGASDYALLISGDCGQVVLTDCSMEGFITPVLITGSVVELLIRNCVGYNDQDTVINTLAHITDGTAYSAATQGANDGTSYYGPSLVMFTANSSAGGTFQVNGGTPQGLLANQFVTVFLNSPYDTIQFNVHPPATFSWTGR